MNRLDLFKQMEVQLAAGAIIELGKKFSDNEKALKDHLLGEVTKEELCRINNVAVQEGQPPLNYIPQSQKSQDAPQQRKGKYERFGIEDIENGNLEYSSTDELAILSLKVLDTIAENSNDISVKDAMLVLKDAADIYLQIRGF